jgi:mitochondrial pyruvate carrier 2
MVIGKGAKKFMDHPAGPLTIHFWAPLMKWCLVFAGLSDIHRPPEQLSTFQSTALATTGIIWTRYSTQITPINYSLLAVNTLVGALGLYQLYRINFAPRGVPQN